MQQYSIHNYYSSRHDTSISNTIPTQSNMQRDDVRDTNTPGDSARLLVRALDAWVLIVFIHRILTRCPFPLSLIDLVQLHLFKMDG